MQNDYPTTRHDLLARVRASRAELERFIGGLSAEQRDAPGPDGGWSVRDHLCHLAAWERKALAQLRGGSIPVALGIDRATWDSNDIDAINGAIRARCRDLPPAEALAFCRESHQELLRELARYPEADYGKPGYPDWAGSAPMIAYIAGNSYEHYPEHLGYIKALVSAE